MLKIAGRIIYVAVCLGFAILVTLLLVVPSAMTLILRLDYEPSLPVRRWLMFFDQARFPAIRVFCHVWVFFLGGCFASFLNVVAWRVPRGKSILGSSQCPQCSVKLTFPRANLPVLGWLRNGGRCGKCEVPIPVRYLIAELVLGFAFLILFVFQTTSGGVTIPFRTPDLDLGIHHNLLSPGTDLLLTLGFHLTILSLIFTLAIAATENFSAPISLVVAGIIATIGFQSASAAIGIVDFQFGNWEAGIASGRFLKMAESPTEFLTAAALGIAASAVCFLAICFSDHRSRFGAFGSLLLIGIAFGWQAVLSITVITCVLLPLVRFNVTGIIFIATLIHLCLWQMQTLCEWWPGPASGPRQMICAAVYIGLFATFYRYLASQSKNATTSTHQDLPTTVGDLE